MSIPSRHATGRNKMNYVQNEWGNSTELFNFYQNLFQHLEKSFTSFWFIWKLICPFLGQIQTIFFSAQSDARFSRYDTPTFGDLSEKGCGHQVLNGHSSVTDKPNSVKRVSLERELNELSEKCVNFNVGAI